jgi:hypothetical protein
VVWINEPIYEGVGHPQLDIVHFMFSFHIFLCICFVSYVSSNVTTFHTHTQLFPEFDSVLIDSPLNETGFAQAKALARALHNYPKGRQEDVTPQLDKDIAALRG